MRPLNRQLRHAHFIIAALGLCLIVPVHRLTADELAGKLIGTWKLEEAVRPGSPSGIGTRLKLFTPQPLPAELLRGAEPVYAFEPSTHCPLDAQSAGQAPDNRLIRHLIRERSTALL